MRSCFHNWVTVEFIGLAYLHTRDRCSKCGKERLVRVVP